MEKILHIIICVFVICGIMFYASVSNADYKKDQQKEVFHGLDTAAGKDVLPMEVNKDNPGATASQLIGGVVNRILQFLGAIFLVLTIYGGFLWMTAGGNDEQVGNAKKIIVAAVVGLALVLAAYAVSWFIVTKIGAVTIKG